MKKALIILGLLLASTALAESRNVPSDPLLLADTVWFCGELGANGDEFFAGPSLENMLGNAITDHTLQAGTCDALGNTAVGMVDNDIDLETAYRVNGMWCNITAGTTTTALTVLTFVDDTVNTNVTCSIPIAGHSCTATNATAEIAANSQVAISSLNATDDLNASDMNCRVYITWR